jgi:hypothetical protein
MIRCPLSYKNYVLMVFCTAVTIEPFSTLGFDYAWSPVDWQILETIPLLFTRDGGPINSSLYSLRTHLRIHESDDKHHEEEGNLSTAICRRLDELSAPWLPPFHTGTHWQYGTGRTSHAPVAHLHLKDEKALTAIRNYFTEQGFVVRQTPPGTSTEKQQLQFPKPDLVKLRGLKVPVVTIKTPAHTPSPLGSGANALASKANPAVALTAPAATPVASTSTTANSSAPVAAPNSPAPSP